MKIIKRDGREVPFDYRKIRNAIEAANAEVAESDRLSRTEVGFIVGRIEKACAALARAVHVEEIQDMIIDELERHDHYRLARHYSEYRLRHEQQRHPDPYLQEHRVEEKTNKQVSYQQNLADAQRFPVVYRQLFSGSWNFLVQKV